MRKVLLLILFLPSFFFQNGNAKFASYKIDENVVTFDLFSDDETSDGAELSAAYSYISDAVKKLLEGLDLSGLDEEFSEYDFFQGKGSAKDRVYELITGDYDIDSTSLIKSVISDLFGEIGNLSVYFAIIAAIVLLSALVDAIKPSFMDKSLTDLTHFVCLIVIVGIVGAVFGSVYKSTLSAVENLERQSEIIFPILLTLMTASGGSVSASIFQPQVAFLTKAMSYIVKAVLMPIVLLLFVFSSVGFLSDRFNMEKARQFLKSAFKWLTGLTAVLFNFFVTAQGLSASVYDGVSLKALKYALGNSIPLVGNLVSSGFDVCFASLILIKNAVGGFALIAIMAVVMIPIIKIAALSLFLRFTAAVIEPVADKRVANFLSGVADTSGYLSAASIVCAASYFITILLIICSLGGAL